LRSGAETKGEGVVMANKRISFWHKFRIHWFKSDCGWFVQILFGIVFITFRWNYTISWDYYDRQTGLSVGYIPWLCCEGQNMPAKNWLKVTDARIGGGM